MTSLSLPISAPSQHQQNNMSSPIHPLLSGTGAGLSLSLPSHPSTTLALPTSPLSLPTTSLALPLPPHQQPTQQQSPSPIAQNVRETSVATTHSLADLADACLSVEPLPLAAPEGSSGTGGYMGAGGLAPGFHLAPDGSARRDPGQEVVMHALFPAFYRAFYTPNDQAAKLAFPASPCAGATTCHCVPMPAHAHLNHSANGSSTPASPSAAMVPGQDLVPCEQICHKDPSPRNSLYTPRITKGRGREKMGLCPICFEPPERGGESKVVWHGLPTSKYRAHMIEKHGISTIDGGGYSCPVTIREVESIPVRSRKKERGTKYMAMCHQCKKEIELVDTCTLKRQRPSINQEGQGQMANLSPHAPENFLPKAYKTWYRHATECHVLRLSDIHGARTVLAQHAVSRLAGETPNTFIVDAVHTANAFNEDGTPVDKFVRMTNRDTLKVKGVKWGRTLKREAERDAVENGVGVALGGGGGGVGELMGVRDGSEERGAKRRRIDVDGLEGGRGSLRGTPTPMTPERLAMDIALGSRPPSVALGTPPEGFGEKVEDGSFEGSPGLGADVVQMALVIANPDHQQ